LCAKLETSAGKVGEPGDEERVAPSFFSCNEFLLV
jgi:hypothetical protein